MSVVDVKSGLVNKSLTPGKNIRIIGHKLKIDGPDPSNGIYFIPEAGEGTICVNLRRIEETYLRYPFAFGIFALTR
jgi:hypothetical protein